MAGLVTDSAALIWSGQRVLSMIGLLLHCAVANYALMPLRGPRLEFAECER
jgi:hypothetical protein